MNDYELKGYLIDSMFKEKSKPLGEQVSKRGCVFFIASTAEFVYDDHVIKYEVIKWLIDKKFLKFHCYQSIGDVMMFRYGLNPDRPVTIREE